MLDFTIFINMIWPYHMTMNYMYELGLPLNLFKLGLTQLQN